MSLTDILKTIKSEAEEEAEKIMDDGRQEEKKLKKELAGLIKKDQEKLLADFRNAMEKKVKQVKFQKESAKKTMLLKKKREILDSVYEQVIERIIGNDEIYGQVIKKATENLPSAKNSEIVLAGENPEKTKMALGAARLKYKISDETVEARGGFVLKSETLEIDNTVEALVGEIRNETEIEVCWILFSE
ncbi:hypothetical protein KKD19_02155 [Patescibacteria group bacterium]|nr:hypothetical protein [Patescibacteria group bacterium]MBU4512028.1 hypothetical protein [Patescibacteria group bacterium]MCG2693195.1 hypothetical protein [Candidatus Parcubacteria bacterium]